MERLIHGDCLKEMDSIPDGSIDMILCDLPYGTTQNKWDSVIPLDGLWAQYKRVIKTGGCITLFSQQPFSASLIVSNLKWFRYEWIWRKSQGTGFLNANRMPLKIHENILIFYDKLPLYNPQKEKGYPYYRALSGKKTTNYGKYDAWISESKDGSRYPVDVVEFPQVNCSKEGKHHPTQKPVPLLEYLIKTYTNEGDVVLDNCMGSGSTGVACVSTGRNFIGIELDEGYFKIAQERIDKAKDSLWRSGKN